MNNEDMLKAIGEMIDSKLGEVNSRFDEIDNKFNEIKCELKEIKTEQSSMKKELQEFRKDTNERFDTLEEGFDILNTKNANNHVIIKGDIDELKKTSESTQTTLELVKIATVANSKDIEKLRLIK